ncbi:MAG: hypothetical protein WC939_00590 [Acholeplasmataceae bacterium]
MKNRVYIVVALFLVLIYSITMGIFLDNSIIHVTNERALGLLWIAKGVSWLVIVGTGLYILLNKDNHGHAIILSVAATIFQIVPLLLRVFLRGDNPNYLMALVITFVSVIAFFSVLLLFDLSNDKKRINPKEN